ncbi:MAG: argininosuccinate synthase [Bacteroidia bacterium]|nr:argininosuccinate synthase [Bacteroidia bacterium]
MTHPLKKKVVLAYSGGLDTSVILKWLINKGYQVICFVADVGQGENFREVEAKAIALGASKVFVEDLKSELVVEYIFPALRGNALYEGRYLLGTAIARPLIAKRQVEIAKREGCTYLAHGATGQGNDQGRCAYIPIKQTIDKSYSEDENLMHISHEAGILESPAARCPEHVYSKTLSPMHAPDKETLIEIEFHNGTPVRIKNLNDGIEKCDPMELFTYANHIAGVNGIGRIDLVENRFIGIKSRGIYETPGGYLLWAAHRDLEGIAMDKEVMHLRDMLTPKFSELIYNGLWFSPEMDFLMAAFNKSQEQITGTVVVSLYKGNAMPVYRESPVSLYDQNLSSMDVEGGFDATDSRGFININAIRLKAHYLVLRKKQPYQWRPGILK